MSKRNSKNERIKRVFRIPCHGVSLDVQDIV